MISHHHRCIFIHIPKCAGTSIKYFLFPDQEIHWKNANYEVIHGWCPERKFFMQHATSKQLLETNLVSQEQWDTYYKFTFVRNPWERAVSDYFWLMKDRGIKDTFSNYLRRAGKFSKVLNEDKEIDYRGDHLDPQTDFFDMQGPLAMDYVGRFENFQTDIKEILKAIGSERPFDQRINASKKKRKHYSRYYSDRNRDYMHETYRKDVNVLGYDFEDRRTAWDRIRIK